MGDLQFKPITVKNNRDIFLKKGVFFFNICTLSYIPIEEYIAIISKNQNYLKRLYFYRNKLKVPIHLTEVRQYLLNLCSLPTLSNFFLGQCMTSPYKRACHQTNFSQGEFRK